MAEARKRIGVMLRAMRTTVMMTATQTATIT